MNTSAGWIVFGAIVAIILGILGISILTSIRKKKASSRKAA